MRQIFDIKIENNGQIIEFEGKGKKVCMIPFKGYVKGDIFEGIVEPFGVDTQIVNTSGIRHMSARYILTGKDHTGKECHIYVENDGWFEDNVKMMHFKTTPTFITDSKELQPYLETMNFVGEGKIEEDGLHIRFYEIQD